jgi:hypothetical protein
VSKMNTSGIEITAEGVQVQVNDEWCSAEVIADQGELLFLAVDIGEESSHLQTWESDGEGGHVVK